MNVGDGLYQKDPRNLQLPRGIVTKFVGEDPYIVFFDKSRGKHPRKYMEFKYRFAPICPTINILIF